MGNKVVSPFLSYENAQKVISSTEISILRDRFKMLCRDNAVLTTLNFSQIPSPVCNAYIRRYILSRMFTVIDTKKDGILDFEEYTCAVALFRTGNTEDKLRFFFLMYEPVKGGFLTRDQIRQIVVDSYLSQQRESSSKIALEDKLTDLKELAEGMVDTVLYQFGSQEGKIDFQEFVYFVQMDPSAQSFLRLLANTIDF